jgi:hypothetical protein
VTFAKAHPAIEALTPFGIHSDVSAALAFSRGPTARSSDPEILEWAFACRDEYRVQVLNFVALRIIVHGAMRGMTPNPDTFARASIDVLDLVQHRRCPPAGERALQCRVRKAEYLELRRVGEAALLRAIRRALVAYIDALFGAPELRAPGSRQDGNDETGRQRSRAEPAACNRGAPRTTGFDTAA